MNFAANRLWMYSLVPQGVAMGLSSLVTILFLVTTLKGNLFEVGLLAGISSFSLIPSVIFWGWLTDKSAKCKHLMMFSFIGTGVIFMLMPAVQSVYELLILAAVKSVVYAASMPTRQILTVESESRNSWQSGVARLQFLEGLGETGGLALGVISAPILGFGPLFTICGLLLLSSAATTATSVHDPALMIERRLTGLERFTNTLVTASTLISHAASFAQTLSPGRVARLFRPSLLFFTVGIFSFSLGGAALYSPLPVFFLRAYSSSTVFLLFFANAAANTLGYLFVTRIAKRADRTLVLTPAFRMLLIPVLAILSLGGISGFVVTAGVLAAMGGIWALFDVSSTCMFMELSQLGRAGLYGAFIGLGSALGSLLGGYISMAYGFGALFGVCTSTYALSLIAFIVQFRRHKAVISASQAN
jgi:predicted MFS family arabinose efflux permease